MKNLFFLIVAFLSMVVSGCAVFSNSTKTQNVLDDSILAIKIERVLANNPTLNLFKIEVAAYQGVVTLKGHVPTEARKRHAADSAASVEGVRAVENLIQIGQRKAGESFQDAVIISKITNDLIRDPLTHSLSIDVETNKGQVMLTGRVKSKKEKQLAEMIALDTEGVLAVENRLRMTNE
jgi:osmotically-inducible protein OsmY